MRPGPAGRNPKMCRLRRHRSPGPAPAVVLDLPRCARRGFRCAPRLRRAPQSGDAHSKRATGPLWIPRRESPCDPALRAGTLRCAAFGGIDRRVPPRQAGRLLARPRSRRKKGAQGGLQAACPGYARRPLKGPRRPFGTRFEPPTAESFVRKQGAKLAPLENPPAAHVHSAAGRRLVSLHPTILLSEDSPGTHGGKQRPFRAFARSARVRGEAAQFSAPSGRCAPRKSGRASPKRTPGTVPETRRQRHCARGAAAGGML